MTFTEKYKQHYLPGFDCRMTTFRNNLAFYGSNLSNGMVLGLSGCLSFIYSTPAENRIPFYTILGITDQTLEGLSCVFDSYLTRGEFQFKTEGIIELLKANLQKNILVNAAINRPLLNHLRQGKQLKDFVVEPTNVGFHFVTITEIEDKTITFFETDFAQPLKYDIETFMHLWFYDEVYGRAVHDPNQTCNGKYYTIQPPGVEAHKNKHTLLFAIDKVATSHYANNKTYSHGQKGMERFLNDIQNWDANIDKNCLINSIFFMKILEMNLSGGGFGRRLYSSFLAETASLMQDDPLKSIAMEFRATSKIWANFINSICAGETINKIMANDFSPIKSLANKYSAQIIDAEGTQFENLKNWVASK